MSPLLGRIFFALEKTQDAFDMIKFATVPSISHAPVIFNIFCPVAQSAVSIPRKEIANMAERIYMTDVNILLFLYWDRYADMCLRNTNTTIAPITVPIYMATTGNVTAHASIRKLDSLHIRKYMIGIDNTGNTILEFLYDFSIIHRRYV